MWSKAEDTHFNEGLTSLVSPSHSEHSQDGRCTHSLFLYHSRNLSEEYRTDTVFMATSAEDQRAFKQQVAPKIIKHSYVFDEYGSLSGLFLLF